MVTKKYIVTQSHSSRNREIERLYECWKCSNGWLTYSSLSRTLSSCCSASFVYVLSLYSVKKMYDVNTPYIFVFSWKMSFDVFIVREYYIRYSDQNQTNSEWTKMRLLKWKHSYDPFFPWIHSFFCLYRPIKALMEFSI